MSTPKFQALIWDFGGVVTRSPFETFARYEVEHNLPEGFIRGINARNPDTNAWAQFEQARIDAEAFDTLFAQESKAQGHEVSGRTVLGLLSGALRPRVVQAIAHLRDTYTLGCITNNMPGSSAFAPDVARVMGHFHHVLESAKLGIRKPDPRIYAMMCEALGVQPQSCIFMDDLGINLKPARAMGMTTIKVTSEDQLLADLSALLGHSLA